MSFPALDFDDFTTPYDENFPSYTARSAAPAYHHEPPPPSATDRSDPTGLLEGTSPEQVDNKLLGFSAPMPKVSVVDDSTGTFANIHMSAELYGMFFVAEDVFETANTNTNANGASGPQEGNTQPTPGNGLRPLELTCYRRNLWQCSGQVRLPRQFSSVIDDQGRNVPIFELAASIAAIESIEGKPTEIVTIPWKSTANLESEASASASASSTTSRANAPPANITLDLSSGTEVGATMVSMPVSWKRLQFKHATANNGRRKGVQQHYQVQISLLGRTTGKANGGAGEWIRICEIRSGPVIVRGRSPRNFDSRRDVPLMADKKPGEKRHGDVKVEKGEQRFHSAGIHVRGHPLVYIIHVQIGWKSASC
jgi:hypothetical protein